MKLFEGRSAKERKSAIANVIAVMRADGSDVKEVGFLGAVCSRVTGECSGESRDHSPPVTLKRIELSRHSM